MGRKRNELRNAASLILKLRIIVAVRSEDRFLYANFSAPPPLLASAPHFICSGNATVYKLGEIQCFYSKGAISDPHITFLRNLLGTQLIFILK